MRFNLSIFDALNREYGTEFFSEHDHRFWGFDTAEEWDKFQNQIAKGNNDDFYFEGSSSEEWNPQVWWSAWHCE
jgi:hypothetical protein